jgi:hypothetical protein
MVPIATKVSERSVAPLFLSVSASPVCRLSTLTGRGVS